MKFAVILPLLFSIAAFILALLSLLAGKDAGYMEEYHIVVFNTSALGQNAISSLLKDDSSATSTTASPTSTSTDSGILGSLGGIWSSIEASATALAGSLESEAASLLNDIGNDVADKLSDELGIAQFYGVHVTDVCQGSYEPNSTAVDVTNVWYNTTNCSAPFDFSAMNISLILERELSLGPFNFSLSDLGITSNVQSKLNELPKLFKAMAALYIIGIIFAGLSILACLASLPALPKAGHNKLILLDFVFAFLSMLFLLLGCLVSTIGGRKAQTEIREQGGDEIGLDMSIGKKFLGISWASFALMALSTFYWVYEFLAATMARRRAGKPVGGRKSRGEQKPSMESGQSGTRRR